MQVGEKNMLIALYARVRTDTCNLQMTAGQSKETRASRREESMVAEASRHVDH